MSDDPKRCCMVDKNGVRCPEKPMYKIGRRGFCERHKPDAQQTRKLSGTTTIATDQRNYCGY